MHKPVDDVASIAVRFLTVELPELLDVTRTAHAGVLEALAAVLADAPGRRDRRV
jgi:hypothetical protein